MEKVNHQASRLAVVSGGPGPGDVFAAIGPIELPE